MTPASLSRIAFTAALALASASVLAQSDPSTGQPASSQSGLQQENPNTVVHGANPAHDQNSGPDGNARDMKDKIFLRKAAEGGMAEIQLGQLASQKAGSDEVKTFAGRMVTDHTDLNNELKPFADSLGVRTPRKLNAKDAAEYSKLNGLSGDDFDKEYLEYMVKDHREDLDQFRMESGSTSDAALKAAVAKGEAVIRQHNRMVTALARSKGVSVPGRVSAMGSTATQ